MKEGYQNEIDFINYLNNKKYKDVNILFQELLSKLYSNIEQEDIIVAYKYGRYAKVDIVININGVEKGISIKSGMCNSVHVEPIDKFVSFLENLGFKETDKLQRYLYSDGTNNNTGVQRQSSEEYRLENYKNIEIINSDLSQYNNILTNRFLINSDVNYRVNVDAFIFGYLDDFLWVSKDEVLKYLAETKIISNSVHVNNLFIQNWNKNLKYNPRYEYCRNYIQVKWYSIFDDIIKIMMLRK